MATMALSEERSCAEALMMACDERLGAQSPAALMVCDTFLARDLWTSFVHQSYLPPAASEVWGCGFNNDGELGLGDETDRTSFEEVTALHGRCIHAVACGAYHTMAVVDDGELWAAGRSFTGQLGLGDRKHRIEFTRVEALDDRRVIAVACGEHHTLALLESGELLAWGYNTRGVLGLGDRPHRKTPEPVAFFNGRRVAAIACKGYHSMALLETGELFTWGWNDNGQLGLGNTVDCNSPAQVTALAGKRIAAVSCGAIHSAAVLDSGELFMWGSNEHGQLGLGDRTDRNMPQLVDALRGRPVKSIACGGFHTLVVIKAGEVYAWGKNDCGQLGLGKRNDEPSITPQQLHFFDGKCVTCIQCGDSFSGAVLECGEMYTWGENEHRQLGTSGIKRNKATPTLVETLAGKHVLAIALGIFHSVASTASRMTEQSKGDFHL